MNKRSIDKLIPKAYEVLSECGIAKDGEINKAWRGQISSFGASIVQGSLLAAVSFFSAKGGADVNRPLLMDAIAKLIKADKPLFFYVQETNEENEQTVMEDIVNAAIALKLAMNLYKLK